MLGERERDRARAAVQVEHGLRAGQARVLDRAGVQPLGLRVVDLIERLGREQERVAAQAVLQHRLAPEHVRPVAQDHIVAALVVVDEDAGQRRRGCAQPFDQHVERGQLARRRDERELALAALFAHADVNMPHRAALRRVIIRRHVKFAHPLPHDGGDAVRGLGLDEAPLDRHDVVAVRPVKAGDDIAVLVPPDRVLRLVAVMQRRFRARDAEQLRAVLLSDAGERVAHLFLLRAQFFLVGDVLIAAAAALVRRRAGGRDARRGRHDQLFQPPERDVLRHLHDAHVALVADRRARHEHRAALDLGEARAVRRVVRDLAAVNLVFLQIHVLPLYFIPQDAFPGAPRSPRPANFTLISCIIARI